MNWLAAYAEMAVRQNLYSIEKDKDFVMLNAELYLESLRRSAHEQEEFVKKMTKKLLATKHGT